ncbi:TetR-like C-terminal domain-containing protein [Microbacterium invictum]|uniref:TetR-like C-terminal domain-containing protein n=1 Tax=Microbacterium invictum TaxID=515415 RepID=A0ABZ0V9H3_9MICO|nr:TetR-like C-terminal domain-containing protein [Microbacterium invictum]WQB69784.1 TetR-like C-terminal domain-containing protein [Microbacterium invictum]
MNAKRDLGDVLARASVGRSGADAISAMSHAYREWALAHPARYAASNLMPAPGDVEDEAVSLAAIQVIADVLTAYRLEGDDAVDAIRAFRSTLHGFVSYETAGAFRWSAEVDRSFGRLVAGFILALDRWADTVAPASAPPTARHKRTTSTSNQEKKS